MNRSKNIETEWIELAPKLASAGYLAVPYRVPEGYFQGFFDRLMLAIRAEEKAGFNTGVGMSLNTDESAAAEMESISPLLAGLSRKTPYQVPENYFSQFRVSEEKTTAGETPVIKMRPRRSWMGMAVAAAITAAVLTGSFFYFRPAAIATVAGQLAQVSDQDMENFVATQDMPPDAGDSAAMQADASTAHAAFNDNEISDLMSNVSDNELQAYASNDSEDSNLN